MQKSLSQQPSPSLTTSSFNAVRAIGSTLCPGEEVAVTALVPVLVGAVNAKMNIEIVSTAVRALVALPYVSCLISGYTSLTRNLAPS